MTSHAFIVTKPLQLLIALIIQKQLDIESQSTTIIVDAFYDAIGTSNRLLRNSSYKGHTLFQENHVTAYTTARKKQFDNLYIDTDVGLKKYIQLLRHHRHQTISVYEEGIGTYRKDLYKPAKKFALKLLGAGTHFGGCALTSNVFVFNPSLYESNFPSRNIGISAINIQLQEFITQNLRFLCDIFHGSDLKITDSDSNINIYLTNWNINSELINIFDKLPGHNFIKLHPHIKSLEKINTDNTSTISQAIPAELFIVAALKSSNKVIVYHHGTSSQSYLNSDNLVFMLANTLAKS
jgi:hypothetical protein